MRTQVINTVRACFAALLQIRSVRRSLPQLALLTLIRTLVITKLDQCNSVLVGTSVYLQDRLQSVLNAAARLSTRAGRQNTQPHSPHCYGSFTGCASRNESSSGCVFWRTIVCMAQHRRTCLTACGRHQRSSVVDVSALLTPRHYKCRRLVRLLLATAPFRWLQRMHGTVCH